MSRGFTPRAVATIEAEVRAFVVGAHREPCGQRIRDDGRADFVAELASPLPSFVVAHYLGVPEADRAQFDRWSTSIVAANAAGDVLGGARDAVGELYGYFTELDRAASPPAGGRHGVVSWCRPRSAVSPCRSRPCSATPS